MKKLTKREIVLIYIAVLMVIGCGAYYLIYKPAYVSYKEAEVILEQVTLKKNLTEVGIKAGEELEKSLLEDKEYYSLHKDEYWPVLSDYQMEQILIERLEACGLELDYTSITSAAICSLEELNLEQEAHAQVYTGLAEAGISGSAENMKDFLQVADKETSMEIESLELKTIGKDCVAQISVRFYMIEQKLLGDGEI